MSHFHKNEAVLAKQVPGSFLRYWPNRTLADVSIDGEKRTMNVNDLARPLDEGLSPEAWRALESLRQAAKAEA